EFIFYYSKLNNGVDRYLSPFDGNTVTTVLPLPNFFASSNAAYTAAPEEIPPRIPSSLASFLAYSNAVSFSTFTIPSYTSVSNVSGTNPAPSPCSLCGPDSPPESTGESDGSSAYTFVFGLFSFNTCPTPVTVPPVPTPAMNASIVNPALFACSTSSFAFLIAPFIPSAPGVKTSSAPYAFNKLRRSLLIVSGITKTALYPLLAAPIARPIPVLPLVGSTIVVSFVNLPASSAASIIARAIRSLTEEPGFINSNFT